jgi:hypothetical protein
MEVIRSSETLVLTRAARRDIPEGVILHVRNMLSFFAEVLLAHAQPTSWRITRCRMSAGAYSMYSQLPSIARGRLPHPQPEDVPCYVDKGPA